MGDPDRIYRIAKQLREEGMAKINSDPRFQGADRDRSVALQRQQAIQRLEREIGNATDLALSQGW
jgi:hypothetical protein